MTGSHHARQEEDRNPATAGGRVVQAKDGKAQEFEWGSLTWLASGELGNSAHLTVGRCVIKPGCENPRHSHPNCEEVLHVLKGRILHSIGKTDVVEMNEGDTIGVPPRVAHNARNIGSEPCVLLVSFSSADRRTQGE